MSAAKWEVCVGLEIHAQIQSLSKLFSGSSAASKAASFLPNSRVSFFDAAMPGTLPSVNKACVAQAVRTAHALQSDVNLQSVFERKHYFYCDLPLGYQITQQRAPIASNGVLKFHVKHSSNDVAARNTNFSSRKEKNAAQKQLAAATEVEEGIERQVRINRIQIEQDSGKSLHTLDATHVDLNRAGTGLMEIVFEPDLRSAAEAGQVLREVQHLLRHIGTCDGNMEDGSMRCDLNVSVRPKSDVEAPFGERVEVKNMNSIRHLMRAVEYEMERQVQHIETTGRPIEKETRTFDAATGMTKRMRSKEGAKDYRFFPEPDLPPLVISPAFVADAKASLPELPDQMKARLVQQYGLTAYESSVLVLTPHAVEFFEQVAQGRPHKLAANWVLNELFSLLKATNTNIHESPVTPSRLGDMLDLIVNETISGKIAKDLIQHMYYEDTTARPLDIVERHGWKLITDDDALRQYCQAIVSNPKHAKNVAAFQKGKSQLFGFFVGQVMKETEGRAHPEKVNAILRSLLAP
ncbi:aspartyl/glutamyl-tRNA(Asn/Gln) amidotransferase, B subunit [Aphanomyces invadans]|uniref:Glutamyl-tRNA(Gln) amidotransferase subunit B, mitochondrial n=1 Tax=Aphanomyces invadans TaxID=157072 RepID=A0A024UAY1_9STRA|nr:aspartyl/glutamyl-tRNA(Asn/Gln) amidotransferase, B subunit [Aphanomyces invadans]ETW03052.1 aspartyl/glutamyl-tRNA(Asn/Gln) amidotransferase, B subunit [Aphanomyces invadans]|eukprot:XP_008868436.1 aspartyl/glutamyl-tRNA(Asn/Gln) amidotransferase, B subunit [Aphanomyces invadans]